MYSTQHPAALTLIAALLIAGCGSNDVDSPNPLSPRVQPARGAQPPDCGVIDLASDEYGTEIHPTNGPPGTEVVLSGTTVRGKDGRWAPSHRLEAWWNTEVPARKDSDAPPIQAGPVVQLTRVDNMERCRFEAAFKVPEARPGRYQISVFTLEDDPSEGYGFSLPKHFTVTHD